MIEMGVDVGSKQKPTGICVAQEERRDPHALAEEQADQALEEILGNADTVTDAELSRALEAVESARSQSQCWAEEESHFIVRYLDPLPAGIPFPVIADRVGEILAKVTERTDESLTVYVNATGKGTPVVDLLREVARRGRVVPVYFTHGDRRAQDQGRITLGKAFLVCRLQTLLQTGRLHLPRTSAAEVLAAELRSYEVEIEPDANERYGAFSVGSHDELVTALGLAVQTDPARWDLT